MAQARAYVGNLSTTAANDVYAEIIAAATAANSESNRPLPLLASWTGSHLVDTANAGFTPAWQKGMIDAGHRLFPWFAMPDTSDLDISSYTAYYSSSIASAQTHGLPIGLLFIQWEDDLIFKGDYLSVPISDTPLVINPATTQGVNVGYMAPINRGTNYQIGDVLTVVGGTFTTPAQCTVGSLMDGGPIRWVTVTNQGAYTVFPSGELSVTGGSGTGATFAVVDKAIQLKLSPLGAVEPWETLGAEWGASSAMQYLQAQYPSPPLIHIILNNEAGKLDWWDANNDKNFTDLYGTGQSNESKREKVAAGWITRYNAMQDAALATFNATWQANARFIGYEAFGPRHFARWEGWIDYSLYNTNRISPYPLMWDGGSPSYYLDGNPGHDDEMFCAQIEAQNYQFMFAEQYALNPDFWFELSVWNGCDSYPIDSGGDGYCSTIAGRYPGYNPTRYAGWVQFGMWLTRPRAVREFRYSQTTRAAAQPYFDALVVAVDRVHDNATLSSFWKTGTLVPNNSRAHPFQSNVPSEYASVERMFMLTTNLDPAMPWADNTALPVFVLARVKGTAPSRTWLLYAHSPGGNRTGVVVTIPGVGNVTINTAVGGSFYTVAEGGTLVAVVVT